MLTRAARRCGSTASWCADQRTDLSDVLAGTARCLWELPSGEAKQRQIELALEELSVSKGSVARYTVTETHIGAAIRNGELYVSSPNAADVQAISFAPFDINGQPTRPANTGDIIEFVQVARDVGGVTRYRIVDGGDSQALVVEYISGNNNFVKGESEEVYIYPQNDKTASKEYVDEQDALKVNLSGENTITTAWRIKTSNKSFISITANEMKLYHIADPTNQDDGWAANKGYVDNQVSGLASEQYVDDAVAGISIPDAGVQETDRIIPKPSRWTYKKDQDRAEDLGRGEFMFNAAKDRLYLAHWNEFGYRWFVRAAEYRWTFNGYTMVSITDYESGIKFMAKISNINYNVNGSSSDNNYCRLDLEHGKLDMEPFNNSRYLITIPGLLPSWRYEPFSEYGRPT